MPHDMLGYLSYYCQVMNGDRQVMHQRAGCFQSTWNLLSPTAKFHFQLAWARIKARLRLIHMCGRTAFSRGHSKCNHCVALGVDRVYTELDWRQIARRASPDLEGPNKISTRRWFWQFHTQLDLHLLNFAYSSYGEMFVKNIAISISSCLHGCHYRLPSNTAGRWLRGRSISRSFPPAKITRDFEFRGHSHDDMEDMEHRGSFARWGDHLLLD